MIYKFVRKGNGRHIMFIDRLLFAAMIEARSCERFRLLSEKINDKELAAFYRDLMVSEANHYTLFISYARKYAGKEGKIRAVNKIIAYGRYFSNVSGVKFCMR